MNYQELRTAMEVTGKLIPPDWSRGDPDGDDVAERWNVSELAPGDPWRHLRWMVQEALSWGPERAEKLNRWLGFVQGTLWAAQVATVQQMRQVNLGAKSGV